MEASIRVMEIGKDLAPTSTPQVIREVRPNTKHAMDNIPNRVLIG